MVFIRRKQAMTPSVGKSYNVFLLKEFKFMDDNNEDQVSELKQTLILLIDIMVDI